MFCWLEFHDMLLLTQLRYVPAAISVSVSAWPKLLTTRSSASPAYCSQAKVICLVLFRHRMAWAFTLAFESARQHRRQDGDDGNNDQ